MDKNPNIYYVYTHRHPNTGIVFYVGKGCKGRAWDCNGRFRTHKNILDAYTHMGYIPCDWVYIEHAGLSEPEAYEKEFELIKTLPAQFLTNDGGLRLSKQEKQNLVKMYKGGKSYAAISKDTGYDHKTLVKALNELGVKPRASYRKGENRYDRDHILSLFEELDDTTKVAEIVGCSYSLVCSVIREHNPDYRGQVRGWRKYNPALIKALRDMGIKHKDITKATGASKNTIQKALKADSTRS